MAFAAARMIRDNQMRERKASSSDIPIPVRQRGGSKVSTSNIQCKNVADALLITAKIQLKN